MLETPIGPIDLNVLGFMLAVTGPVIGAVAAHQMSRKLDEEQAPRKLPPIPKEPVKRLPVPPLDKVATAPTCAPYLNPMPEKHWEQLMTGRGQLPNIDRLLAQQQFSMQNQSLNNPNHHTRLPD